MPLPTPRPRFLRVYFLLLRASNAYLLLLGSVAEGPPAEPARRAVDDDLRDRAVDGEIARHADRVRGEHEPERRRLPASLCLPPGARSIGACSHLPVLQIDTLMLAFTIRKWENRP